MPDTLEILTRAASVAPASINDETRTAEVIWSTGARVERRGWDGPFVEILSLNPAHVNLERLRGGAVLDTHQRDGLRNVLGVVESAEVDGRQGRATIRFSRRPEVEPIWQDVRDGTIRHVSIGYSVEKWSDKTDPNTGERTRTATAWTPVELSLVPVPADPGAIIRSHGLTMPDGSTGAAPALNRAQTNQEIRAIAATAGLDHAFADGLIDRGATVEQARAAAFEELARRSGGTIRTEQPRAQILASHDDPETRCRWMGEALYARTNPSHEVSEPARQYAGLTIPEIARETLRLRGIAVTGMSASAVITRSLHTTSDFSLILGDTVGRQLRAAYEAAPAGIKRVARQTTVTDFRSKTRIMLGSAPTLERVNEHGEFTSGTMAEAAEAYKADTFGRIIGISRQALVNDDTGAFADLSRRFGIAAAQFEAQFLVDLLEGNSGSGPTMSDGKTLFHADHKNVAAAGGSIDDGSLSNARVALRKQTGLSGELISVTPRYLLVPAELETAAEKAVASVQATTTADANPFTSLAVVVEPRLSDDARWFVVADDVDGLEYCYLEGAAGPQIESRNGFEIDGVQIRVRLDFGAGFVDWRGWHTNAGS